MRYFVALAVVLGAVAGVILLRSGTPPPPRVVDQSETGDWLPILVGGGEVEFKTATRTRVVDTIGKSAGDAVVVSSLGPITDDSVRRTIEFFEQGIAVLLEERLDQILTALTESEGEEYYATYDEFLMAIQDIEKRRAAIEQLRAGEYISYEKTFPQDVFRREDYTWYGTTSGVLESGQHVALFIPIAFEKYPVIRQLEQDREKIAGEALDSFVHGFNEKPYEERSKLYQGYVEARVELKAVYATVDEPRERYERSREIAPRLMPRHVFVDEATLLMYKRH